MSTQLFDTGPDIDALPRADTLAIWKSFEEQLAALKSTAETLTVTDASQTAQMKLARTTRLSLKAIRVEVEKRRKELGEEALRRKQAIDGAAAKLKAAIEPLEDRLLEQEEFAEREKHRLCIERHEARHAQIAPFTSNGTPGIPLGDMSDDEFNAMLSDFRDAHASRMAREQKEREEQEARAKAEATLRERLRIENERLRKEAAEREEKARQERLKEQARREVERHKMETERKAREKAERELAEKKAQEQREEAERIAAEEAKAAAPDKAKLKELAAAVRAVPLPAMKTKKAKGILASLAQQIESTADIIESRANLL